MNFDNFGPAYREGEYYTDNWGCVWYNIRSGMEGQVVKRSLEDYSALAAYQPPDSLIHTERGLRGDWAHIQKSMETERTAGRLTVGGGDRFFERLHFLRGYENLMMDFADDPPDLMLLAECEPDVSLENIEAICEVLETVMPL